MFKRRTVVDLAGAVDTALSKLAQAKGELEEARHFLELKEADVVDAQRAVSQARDALFKEHPELVPDNPLQAANHVDGVLTLAIPDIPHVDVPQLWETVEVDDANDPRFTDGVEVSPADGDPLPPIEWAEHD